MQVTYAVGEGGLTVDVTARNGGTGVAPFGYGAHPYLMAGEATVDELTLTVPADSVCEMDLDQLVPVTGSARTSLRPVEQTGLDFRAPRSLDGVKLDAAFTSLPAQWVVRLDGPRAVELWADAAFPWAQVFTGDSLPAGRARNTGVAVEPMTCPPNALATGEWLIHLHPRQEWRGTWGSARAVTNVGDCCNRRWLSPSRPRPDCHSEAASMGLPRRPTRPGVRIEPVVITPEPIANAARTIGDPAG